ncbi:hypothetical protein LI328DRAFT_69733 [Trichoderma asperelloides]|nr:hypothetical protein LI328DRAFT_69733 [Trichoderma asperelloides]
MRPQRQQKLLNGGRRGGSTDTSESEWAEQISIEVRMRAQRGSFSAPQAASQSDGTVTMQCNAEQCLATSKSARCDAMRCDAMQQTTALGSDAQRLTRKRLVTKAGGMPFVTMARKLPQKKVGGIFFGERECERTMVGRNAEQVPWTSCDGLKVGKG